MVPKDQCEHIKHYCIDRNNTWSKLYIERYGPRKTLTVATFTEVLNKLISFMHTEVGLLSWVSHTTIARVIGINKNAVRYYLRAATLIGAVKIKYTYAGAAHEQTIRYYPNYTDHTEGQTFNMMLASEDGKPRRLNYYTVIGCEYWNGRKYNSLPADWKMEVIRLCSKQKTIHLHEAHRLAAKHRITALDPVINHPTRVPVAKSPIVYVNLPPDHPDQPGHALRKRSGKSKTVSPVRPENASANEVVNHVVLSTRKQADEGSAPSSSKTESPVRAESAGANEVVNHVVLSTRKQADEGSAPSSSKTESPVRAESVGANEVVNHVVLSTRKQADEGSAPSSSKPESPVGLENASANEVVNHVVLSTRKQGDEGSAPSSAIEEKQEPGAGKPALAVCGLKPAPGHSEVEPSATPENDAQYQLDREQALRDRETRWLASEEGQKAHQRYLKIRAECLAQMNPGRASSPGPSCGGVPPQPGPIVVEPQEATEDATNPVTVRQFWGPRRATAQQNLGPASRPGRCG